MNGATRFAAVFVTLLLSFAGSAFAQETERWLSSTQEAKPYAAVAKRVITAAESVAAAEVPERLFLERLKEGVRKRAAADRLARTMEEEAARLIFLASELDSSGLRMSAEAREHALADGALFLRASVSREEYGAVVKKIAAEGEAVERVSATISVLAAVDPSRVVESRLRLEFAAAVAGSSIKTDRIDSIIAVFTRGRSFGLSPDRIARIVSDELAAGGTLMAIDGALNRERKNR